MTSLIHSPSADDILLGWETRNGDHIGNRRLKELVQERAEEFLSSEYMNAQIMIVRQVAEELTEDGGRFLCKSVDSGDAWVEAQREYVLENIKQAFREIISTMPPKAVSPTNTTATTPTAQDRISPRHVSPSLASMDLSSRSKVSSPASVTPPARLSPEGRLHLQPGLAKEILLRRLAASQQRGSLSPLEEANRRRKLHMAKMQAILLKKKQEEQQLMHLLRDRNKGAKMNGQTSAMLRGGVGQIKKHSFEPILHRTKEVVQASHLPAQLRLTPMGTRRELDPLAPMRKRKRDSVV